MKHIFLFGVLIFSLLAVCTCKHDLSTSHVTEPQGGEVGKGENPDNNPGQTDNNEPEMPEIIPPEIIPPEIVPPEVVPPEIVQPEDSTQGGETEENENEEKETQEGEDKENEEGKTQEGNDEESIPPQGGEGEEVGRTQEVETTQEPETEEGEAEKCQLIINELRTECHEYLKRPEFIEFKVIKGGCMEGLYLYIVMNNAQDNFVYIFPPIDVETGEYITLHLRNLDKYNCFDELRDDLSISGGADSCPTGRDLWVIGNDKLLYKTSIVYIQDENGQIMDAIVMNEKPDTTWNSNQSYFADITERLFNEGMWKSVDGNKPIPSDAVDTSKIGLSVYKSVSRYEGRENTHSVNDWYITTSFGITPGQANN